MSGGDDLNVLLDQWENFRELGREVTAEELCPNDSTLREELRRQMDLLTSMDTLLFNDDEHTLPDAESVSQMDAGRYRPQEYVAGGGLGQIFLALDTELQRGVALKRMHPWHGRNRESRERFELEAGITGRLEHPGIVPIYGFGLDSSGQPFYAMRFIQGETLTKAVDRYHAAATGETDPAVRSLEFQKLARCFLTVCQTIGFAHSRQIIHRDLKPDNIMVGQFGETLVVDWGLAKPLSEPKSPATVAIQPAQGGESEEGTQSGGQTVMGIAKGSPAYMSPEQADGRWDQVGPASDIYSLGATLYYILTGRRPIDGRTLLEVLDKVKRGEIIPPVQARAGVPPALAAVCLKAMRLKPADRHSSATELAADIERWLADEPVSAWREPWRIRAARWIWKRRTAMSAAAAALVVALVTVSGAAVLLNDARSLADRRRVDAESATEQAQRAEARATKSADAEREQRAEVQRVLYPGTILLAEREIQNSNVTRAREWLEKAPSEYRGWEWHHLQRVLCGGLLTLETSHVRKANDAQLRPDGTLIATAGGDRQETPGEVKLWDARTGAVTKTLTGHAQRVIRIRFNPKGTRLASTSYDGTLRLWSIPDGALLHTFQTDSPVVWGVAFSPDGSLVGGGLLNKVVVWNIESHKTIYELSGHTGQVFDVAFHRETARLASCSSGRDAGEVKLWNVSTGELVRTLDGPLAYGVGSLAFTPDGKRLVTSGRGQESPAGLAAAVRVWDVETGTVARTLEGSTGGVVSVAMHPQGRQMATGGDDSAVRVWNLETGRELFALHGHTGEVSSVAYGADGSRLISTGGFDRSVRVWDATAPVGSRVVESERGFGPFSFSAESTSLAVINNGQIEIRSTATGALQRTLDSVDLWLTHVAVVPGRQDLAAGFGEGKTLHFWITSTGKSAGSLELQEAPDALFIADRIHAMAFAPDGKTVALSTGSQRTQFFNIDTREPILKPLLVGERGAQHLAYSFDGELFATCGDHRVRVWNTATGALLFENTKVNFDSCVAFSPHRGLLAAAGFEPFVQFYDSTSGQPRHALQRHDTGWIHSVSFLPDGSRVATAGTDGNLKIWDPASGREMFNLRLPSTEVQRVSFSPDGHWLAAVAGGRLLLWNGQPLPTVPR